jgi:hypothetical protein
MRRHGLSGANRGFNTEASLDCDPDSFDQVTANFIKWIDDYFSRDTGKPRGPILA